jgi:hypothetical protein
MTMTEEQRSQFLAFSDYIASQIPELNKTLLAEVNRVGEAYREVAGALDKSIDKDDPPSIQKFFVDAQTSQHKLFQENVDLADTSLRALADKTSRTMPTEPSEVLTASELAAAVRQLLAMEFGLAIEKLFTGMTLIIIQLSLEDYLDACETFWGRRIGSHDAKRRFGEILKQLGIASPTVLAMAFPPVTIPVALIGTGIEAVRQWRKTPRKKVFEDLKDAKVILRRVAALTETASTLLDRMFFVKGNAEISVTAVVESRAG